MTDALADTNVGSLNELFNRDPLQLQTADLRKIVEHFRSKRDQFLVAEAGPKAPRGLAPKGAKRTITLDDLQDIS